MSGGNLTHPYTGKRSKLDGAQPFHIKRCLDRTTVLWISGHFVQHAPIHLWISCRSSSSVSQTTLRPPPLLRFRVGLLCLAKHNCWSPTRSRSWFVTLSSQPPSVFSTLLASPKETKSTRSVRLTTRRETINQLCLHQSDNLKQPDPPRRGRKNTSRCWGLGAGGKGGAWRR